MEIEVRRIRDIERTTNYANWLKDNISESEETIWFENGKTYKGVLSVQSDLTIDFIIYECDSNSIRFNLDFATKYIEHNRVQIEQVEKEITEELSKYVKKAIDKEIATMKTIRKEVKRYRNNGELDGDINEVIKKLQQIAIENSETPLMYLEGDHDGSVDLVFYELITYENH